ncbi:hypothetical protein OSTOST_13803, partial [Ostertagia ostertagi]
MARMRSRARSQVQANASDASTEAPVAFDTNVVIQSPATVMDDSTASIPPPSSSTLWEIEMPASGSGGSDASHESHFAAAAAIAVLGRGVHFGDAVAAGRVVRLIYQGQLLREDSRTLASYGLRDGSVVHCHISNTPYARQAPSTSQPVTFSSNVRHRDVTPNDTPSTSNVRPETQEFRYPRWAVALLLYTYRFPLIGLPLDAVIRFLFDRQMAPSAEPGVVRRTYQRYSFLK